MGFACRSSGASFFVPQNATSTIVHSWSLWPFLTIFRIVDVFDHLCETLWEFELLCITVTYNVLPQKQPAFLFPTAVNGDMFACVCFVTRCPDLPGPGICVQAGRQQVAA